MSADKCPYCGTAFSASSKVGDKILVDRKELEELVEAAESARMTLTDVDGYDLSKEIAVALQPFRRSEP